MIAYAAHCDKLVAVAGGKKINDDKANTKEFGSFKGLIENGSIRKLE
jgi:hypothetical protein